MGLQVDIIIASIFLKELLLENIVKERKKFMKLLKLGLRVGEKQSEINHQN